MPNTMKCRRVCMVPEHRVFAVEGNARGQVVLTVDELEALRLCDMEGLDQDTASRQMGISRGTFQRVLYSAREKTAQALCTGKNIVIDGGNYILSDRGCCCGNPCKQCAARPEKRRMRNE